MTVEEITTVWLSRALGHGIKSSVINEVVHGTGSKIFITVEYDDFDPAADNTKRPPTRLCVKGGFDTRIMDSHPEISTLPSTVAPAYN